MTDRQTSRSILARRPSAKRAVLAQADMLEARRLLSGIPFVTPLAEAAGVTIVVNSTADQTNPSGSPTVSLRDAIVTANASSTPTSITFDPSVFANAQTITLGGSQLEITQGNTTISGPSAGVTISGNGQSRVLLIDQPAIVTIDHLTIANGMLANTEYGGGGIYNFGTLTLSNSTLTGNQSVGTSPTNTGLTSGFGGGLENAGIALCTNDTFTSNTAVNAGGGLDCVAGTLTISDCTISANTAGEGGGVSSGAILTVVNSTISGNTANFFGGGVNTGNLTTLTNVTVANNTATAAAGGGISIVNLTAFGGFGTATLTNVTITGNTTAQPTGGGIVLQDGAIPPHLGNTLVAGNNTAAGASSTGLDAAGTIVSNGHNLIGETDGSSGWISTDLAGTISAPITPALGTLADNGGATQTILPLAGSPAIDAGNSALVPVGVLTDQRGFTRIAGSAVDIGATEFGAVLPTKADTTTTISDLTAFISVGGTEVFTATVAGTPGGPTPTGTVNFFSYNQTYPSLTVPVGTDGKAVMTLPGSTQGYQAFIAFYSGDANYAASNSGPLYASVNSSPLTLGVSATSTPPSLLTGAKFKGKVTVVVNNPTSAEISGPQVINVFALRYLNDANDFASQLIGVTTKKLKLAPGSSTKVTVSVNLSVADSVTGSYSILPTITDLAGQSSFGSEHIAGIAAGYTVAAAFDQLAPTLTKLTLPSSIVGGSSFKASATVNIVNNGNSLPAGATTVELLATPDGTAANGTILATLTKNLKIKPGKSTNVKFSIKTIPDVPDGQYTIIARTIDPAQATVISPAFATMITIASPFIDLSVTITPPLASSYKAGKKGKLTLDVTNLGNILASGPATVTLAASTDGTLDIGDATIAVSSKVKIKPAGSGKLKLAFEVPVTLGPGTYQLFATLASSTFVDITAANNTAMAPNAFVVVGS